MVCVCGEEWRPANNNYNQFEELDSGTNKSKTMIFVFDFFFFGGGGGGWNSSSFQFFFFFFSPALRFF